MKYDLLFFFNEHFECIHGLTTSHTLNIFLWLSTHGAMKYSIAAYEKISFQIKAVQKRRERKCAFNLQSSIKIKSD